ncbi:MAG: hypothetical protein WDZ88_01495 [Candidatus Paceibacterota bacterium]
MTKKSFPTPKGVFNELHVPKTLKCIRLESEPREWYGLLKPKYGGNGKFVVFKEYPMSGIKEFKDDVLISVYESVTALKGGSKNPVVACEFRGDSMSIVMQTTEVTIENLAVIVAFNGLLLDMISASRQKRVRVTYPSA